MSRGSKYGFAGKLGPPPPSSSPDPPSTDKSSRSSMNADTASLDSFSYGAERIGQTLVARLGKDSQILAASWCSGPLGPTPATRRDSTLSVSVRSRTKLWLFPSNQYFCIAPGWILPFQNAWRNRCRRPSWARILVFVPLHTTW